jgi:DNA-binding NtrC family response regulator
VDTKGRILIVDEETAERAALREVLRGEGYSVEVATDGIQALQRLGELAPHVVLASLDLPETTGLELLAKLRDEIREQDADTAVLVMLTPGGGSAVLDGDGSVAALHAGAAGYLSKPVKAGELTLAVKRELEQQRLRAEASQLRTRLAERYRFENMIGNSAPMQAVFKTVAQVAAARASVLITGESGTGKELIAAAIHEKSPRARGPFVKLHCTALADTALESELFGHERAAFAGAGARRDGRLVSAHGGTLFLDEIGENSPALQIKLLRFLQEHQFERMGGNDVVSADVRVIAGTTRDLRQLIAAGKFREDLYYNLDVVNVELPALRDRPSDVPLLALYFLRKYAAENGKAITAFSDEALDRLCDYAWPGNVRELENVIERAVVLAAGPRLTSAELPPHLASSKAPTGIQIPGSTLDAIERYAITKTLEANGGSTSRAAEILGISIRKVQYKLHEYQSASHAGQQPATERAKEN